MGESVESSVSFRSAGKRKKGDEDWRREVTREAQHWPHHAETFQGQPKITHQLSPPHGAETRACDLSRGVNW